jgi:hypothetical protein
MLIKFWTLKFFPIVFCFLGLIKLVYLRCAHTNVFNIPEYLLLLPIVYWYNEYLRKKEIALEPLGSFNLENKSVVSAPSGGEKPVLRVAFLREAIWKATQ